MVTQTKDHLKLTFPLFLRGRLRPREPLARREPPSGVEPHFPTRKGFTLLELMIVVVIIGITIAGATFVAQNSHKRTSVKSAARDIASSMRLAHSKAMTLRKDYYVVYDTTNQIVWFQSKESYDDSGKNPDPGSEKKLPKVVVIDEVTLGGSDTHKHHTFTFKGTATGGTVKLRDINNNVQYRVTNVGATARVKMYSSW